MLYLCYVYLSQHRDMAIQYCTHLTCRPEPIISRALTSLLQVEWFPSESRNAKAGGVLRKILLRNDDNGDGV